MSSVDAGETAAAGAEAAPESETGDGGGGDPVREGLLEALGAELGPALVGSELRAGRDLCIRVERGVWGPLAEYLRSGLGFGYFSFLSAIDWLPSPFGRDMDSQVDNALDPPEPKDPGPMQTGAAGGDTRFQLLARVNDPAGRRSLTAKADLPDDDLRAASWTPVYPGADWHEREAWEMFGIDFDGHPGLRHIYLPSQFEGNPLRKDYPLLARRVKPWPGIVDMELMPGEDPAADGADTDGAEGP